MILSSLWLLFQNCYHPGIKCYFRGLRNLGANESVSATQNIFRPKFLDQNLESKICLIEL